MLGRFRWLLINPGGIVTIDHRFEALEIQDTEYGMNNRGSIDGRLDVRVCSELKQPRNHPPHPLLDCGVQGRKPVPVFFLYTLLDSGEPRFTVLSLSAFRLDTPLDVFLRIVLE